MKAREIDWSKAPEGATHFGPKNEEWHEAWYKLDGDEWFAMLTSDDDKWDFVSSVDEGRVSQMIQLPSAWNGTGLPPAGCEIEYHSLSRGWQLGEYIGQFNGQMVVGCKETGVIGYCQSEFVRPIRTPEQIAAEEREKEIDAIEKIIGAAANLGKSAAAAIYDAGYRKVAEARE